MIFFSLKMTGKIPFSEVYCHSLIRDSEGRKMSKSLGNVIDPVDIMDGITLQQLTDKLKVGNLAPKEIERASKWQKSAFPDGIDECGADALRFLTCELLDRWRRHQLRREGDAQLSQFLQQDLPSYEIRAHATCLPGLTRLERREGRPAKRVLPERWILHKMTIAARDSERSARHERILALEHASCCIRYLAL